MECGGNGRARLSRRPISAPWHEEAVGCAEWTGTPLRPILEEAGVLDDAVEVVFSGHDRGIDGGVEHDYERSLPVEEALRDEVLLAYAMNGRPLPPQHGFPLRLIVPDWYGMASVKWLRSIALVAEPFSGVQQAIKYRYKRSEEDPGTPVTRKHPRALMVPPGIPDYLSRVRHVRAGETLVEGRAWSGFGPVERVEFS
jgi:DMSO/TMAO reductase YedYZ molybdopterin-dependent catalytic subunit